MCQLCIEAGLAPRAALQRFAVRAAEARIAKRTLQRRKAAATEKPTRSLTRELRRLWRVEQDRVLDLLAGVQLPYQAKAKEVEAVSADDIARILMNGVDLLPYEAALLEHYREVAPSAMQDLLEMVRRGVYDLRDFPQAQRWISQNAIQFGQKYAGLVSGTTNKAIRAQLAEAWRNFESTDDMIRRVRKVYSDASEYRAEMIARTESNRAYSAAQLEMGKEVGATRKYWIISGSPYSYVDVCSDNANLGVIPIDKPFRDIRGNEIDAPPAHPNCLCDLAYDFAADWELPANLFTR